MKPIVILANTLYNQNAFALLFTSTDTMETVHRSKNVGTTVHSAQKSSNINKEST